MHFRIRLFLRPIRHKAPTAVFVFPAVLAALLTPTSLMACALAAWRMAADLQWVRGFAIRSGPFSHWQVWLTMAVILRLLGAWVDERRDDASRL